MTFAGLVIALDVYGGAIDAFACKLFLLTTCTTRLPHRIMHLSVHLSDSGDPDVSFLTQEKAGHALRLG